LLLIREVEVLGHAFGFGLAVHAIAVLDDGRAVIATPVVNAAGDRVNTQYEILLDL